MHGILLIFGPDPEAQLERAMRKHRLIDGAMLGWGGARGHLLLRPGATGVRGRDVLEADEDVPDIVRLASQGNRGRHPEGWDQARRADITNIEDVAFGVAAVIRRGQWILAGPVKAGIPDLVGPEWFDRVYELLDEADPDELISVYDMHL